MKRRDVWGRDRNTGAKGLEIGIRTVRNGRVKIGGEFWHAVRGTGGSIAAYEGKAVEVGVVDSWSTRYRARDPETFESIATLCPVPPVAEEGNQ